MKYRWEKFAYTVAVLPHYMSDTSENRRSACVRSKKCEAEVPDRPWDTPDTRQCVHVIPTLRATLQPAVSTVPYGESILPQWCVSKCLKDLRLPLQQLQGSHCIFACVQDNAKRLQQERAAKNCFPSAPSCAYFYTDVDSTWDAASFCHLHRRLCLRNGQLCTSITHTKSVSWCKVLHSSIDNIYMSWVTSSFNVCGENVSLQFYELFLGEVLA